MLIFGKLSKRLSFLLGLFLVALFSLGARTLINISTDVIGILPVANAGTGAATAAAGTVFGRSATSGAGAPSFIAMPSVLNSITTPNNGRWALRIATSAGTTMTLLGDIETSTGTGSSVGTTATMPPTRQYLTSTVDTNVASTIGNLNYVVGRSIYYETIRKNSTTTTRRDWVALTDQTSATMGASDNPAGNYVGFWYCNDAGANCQKAGSGYDATNYWCVSKDNVTQQLTDSGIAADTGMHKYIIFESAAGTYNFYIDGVNVCTQSSNPPTSTTPLRILHTVTCMACNPTAQNLQVGWDFVRTTF